MRKIMNERLTLSDSCPLKARFYDYKHFTYPWHIHPEYEIIYIGEGTGIRFVGDNMETFGPGDVLLIGSNLPHYMKSDDKYLSADNRWRVKGTIVQFEKEFMCYSINNYPQLMKIRNLLEESQKGIYFNARSSARLVSLLDRIPMETGVDQITFFLQLLKEMSEITTRRTISMSNIEDEVPHGLSKIDKIISFLNRNYNRHIRLDEIASFAAMNPSAFCRFFKGETGKSFILYQLDLRVARACKLLLFNEEKSIMEISAVCGFDTVSYFNKVFKRSTGYTPVQYKEMMR